MSSNMKFLQSCERAGVTQHEIVRLMQKATVRIGARDLSRPQLGQLRQLLLRLLELILQPLGIARLHLRPLAPFA